MKRKNKLKFSKKAKEFNLKKKKDINVKIKEKTEKNKKKLEKKIEKTNKKFIKEKVPLKLKLSITHIIAAVIPLLIVTFALLNLVKTTIISQVKDNHEKLMYSINENINMKLNEFENISMILLSDDSFMKVISKSKSDYDNLYQMMKEREKVVNEKLFSLKYSNDNIDNICIMKRDEVIQVDSLKDGLENNFFESDEYKKVSEAKGKVVWFSNLGNNKDDIYLMRKLSRLTTSQEIGILVIKIKKDYISQVFESFDEKTYEYIVDENGYVVYNSDIEIVGNKYDSFEKIKEDIKTKEVDKKDKLLGVIQDKYKMSSYIMCENNWLLIEEIPNKVFLDIVNSTKKIIVYLSLVIAVLSIIGSQLISINITYPIKYIRNRMKLVENGDLTAVSNIKGKYDMGQLSHSYNMMLESTKRLINDNKQLNSIVTDNSKEVKEIAQYSAAGSKEVTTAVESVSQGAMEQAKDAENAANIVRELVNRINETEENFNNVVESTENTKTISVNAVDIISELNNSTVAANELSHNYKNNITELVDKFKEILNIIGLIDGISEQSNLLALNAAIEAARAGEAGRGFAVVAEEVRKLAVQSKEAAQDISKIVNNVHNATNNTVKMIEEGEEIFIRQKDAVVKTDDTFNRIVENMETIKIKVDQVFERLSGLEEIQNEAIDSITSIASIAQQSAAAIEEVVATGEEQTSSAEHLVEMSNNLAQVVDKMNRMLDEFKVE
jgi:methyl-accepting chemotaxis protein